MSNYVDEIIKEQQAAPAETQTQTEPQTQPEPAPEPEPSSSEESQRQSGEQQPPEQQPGQKTQDSQQQGGAPQQPTQDTPKTVKDYSSFSKEQKAEYAFSRQLAKQKQKHADEVAAIKAEFKNEIDEIKKLVKGEEKPKTRADFETDDEYIDYLTDRKVSARLEAHDAERKKADDEKAAKDAETAEQQKVYEETANRFNDNVTEYFKGRDSDREAFRAKMKTASDNGLAEILDNAPSVRDFVFTMPDGVAVLNEMLNDRNTFIRVMQASVNPMACTVEMMRVAQEARQRGFTQPQTQQQQGQPEQPPQPQGMPHIGKPGARQGGGNTRPLNSDSDIIDFIRAGR